MIRNVNSTSLIFKFLPLSCSTTNVCNIYNGVMSTYQTVVKECQNALQFKKSMCFRSGIRFLKNHQIKNK